MLYQHERGPDSSVGFDIAAEHLRRLLQAIGLSEESFSSDGQRSILELAEVADALRLDNTATSRCVGPVCTMLVQPVSCCSSITLPLPLVNSC